MQIHIWVSFFSAVNADWPDLDKRMHQSFCYLSSVMQACRPGELWLLQISKTANHKRSHLHFGQNIWTVKSWICECWCDRHPSQGVFGLLREGRNGLCCKNSAPRERKHHQQTSMFMYMWFGVNWKQIWASCLAPSAWTAGLTLSSDTVGSE